jgi:hypothetical protein
MFFQLQQGYFVPMEGAQFFQQLRKEKQTVNVASAQKWVFKGHSIKTIQIKCDNSRNNHTRDKFHDIYVLNYIFFSKDYYQLMHKRIALK